MSITETDEPTYLTVQDLAKRWRTTPQAIYNRRHRRQAPRGFRSGRDVLFPLADVLAFENALLDADPKSPANDPTLRPPETRLPRQRRSSRQPARA